MKAAQQTGLTVKATAVAAGAVLARGLIPLYTEVEMFVASGGIQWLTTPVEAGAATTAVGRTLRPGRPRSWAPVRCRHPAAAGDP